MNNTKTNAYKIRKFNISNKNLEKLLKAIESNKPTNFYLSKEIIKQEPRKGYSIKLLLSEKESENVLAEKPFTYRLTKDKLSYMQHKTRKTGGIIPAIIPAAATIIPALVSAGTSIYSAIKHSQTEKEKNEIQAAHNKEIEDLMRKKSEKMLRKYEGEGLYLTKLADGKGLYLIAK